MARAHVIFEGRVQGVFFRANCRKKAVELGLAGWVRNTDDGKVEAVVEGRRELVERLVAWCRTSQPIAHVTGVKMEWIESDKEYNEFRIIR